MRWCICFSFEEHEMSVLECERDFLMKYDGSGIGFVLADQIMDLLDVLSSDPKVVDSFQNYLIDSGIYKPF